MRKTKAFQHRSRRQACRLCPLLETCASLTKFASIRAALPTTLEDCCNPSASDCCTIFYPTTVRYLLCAANIRKFLREAKNFRPIPPPRQAVFESFSDFEADALPNRTKVCRPYPFLCCQAAIRGSLSFCSLCRCSQAPNCAEY